MQAERLHTASGVTRQRMRLNCVYAAAHSSAVHMHERSDTASSVVTTLCSNDSLRRVYSSSSAAKYVLCDYYTA
jgi:hypothetical protein